MVRATELQDEQSTTYGTGKLDITQHNIAIYYKSQVFLQICGFTQQSRILSRQDRRESHTFEAINELKHNLPQFYWIARQTLKVTQAVDQDTSRSDLECLSF